VFDQIIDLKKRRAHFYSERFGFVASGDHAAVIIGKNNNRAFYEFRVENPFA
jgi:hypothetical protein